VRNLRSCPIYLFSQIVMRFSRDKALLWIVINAYRTKWEEGGEGVLDVHLRSHHLLLL